MELWRKGPKKPKISKKRPKMTKKEEKEEKRGKKKRGQKGTKEDGKGREDRNNVDSNLGYFIDGWGFPKVEKKKISKMYEKGFKYNKKGHLGLGTPKID